MLLVGLLVACVFLAAGCAWIWPAKHQLRKAQKLEAAGNYSEAVAKYEEIAQKYRDRQEALTALSRAAALYVHKLNNWQKAASLLQELRALTEGAPEFAQVMLRLARVLEQSGSPYKDSLAVYAAICLECATEPESVSALLAQGRIYESIQHWTDAKHVYEETLVRLGLSRSTETVRARLQSIWLMEALSTYYAGQVREGARLAEEALKQEVTVPEVAQGLEVLVQRYRLAQHLWESSPGDLFISGSSVSATPVEARFVHKVERGQSGSAPAGWKLDFDEKKKSFTLTERPAVSATGPAGSGSSKSKTRKARSKKPWTYRNSSWSQVVGLWWSPDGRYLGWSAKSRKTKFKELRVLDLKTRKGWRVMKDPAGTSLGDLMLFMPSAGKDAEPKLVFLKGKYLVISDLLGGDQVRFRVRGSTTPRATYHALRADRLACTADGLELAMAVTQRATKKVPAHSRYWQLHLAASIGGR